VCNSRCNKTVSVKLLSLVLLTNPATHKRVGTMIANPIQITIPLAFTRISSICACFEYKLPCSILSLCIFSQCNPACICQSATVLSSNLYVYTIACVGQPCDKSEIAVTKRSSGLRIPCGHSLPNQKGPAQMEQVPTPLSRCSGEQTLRAVCHSEVRNFALFCACVQYFAMCNTFPGRE